MATLLFTVLPFLSSAEGRADFQLPAVPPPRSRAEIETVLRQSPPAGAPDKLRALNILLLAGPKDHHPGEHDYPLWQKKWAPLISKLPGVTVDTAFDWPDSAQLKACDLLVCYAHPGWDEKQLADIDALFDRGAGVVLVHWAVRPAMDYDKFAQRFGLAFPGGRTRHGEITLKLESADITSALPQTLQWSDETYWPMLGDRSKVKILASSLELPNKSAPIAEAMPQIWTCEHPRGRAYCFVPGHYLSTFDDPFFRLLLLRGMAWAAGENVHRFESAATDGVDLK